MIAIERQNVINNRQGNNRLNKVFKELLKNFLLIQN